jgi:hypothetical protein
MVPLINNREEAQQAVSYCRFPPDGIRSVAYPVRWGLCSSQGPPPQPRFCFDKHLQQPSLYTALGAV